MGAQVTLVESARNGDEFFVGGGKNIEEVGAGGEGGTGCEGASTRGECVWAGGVPARDGNDGVLLPVDDDYGTAESRASEISQQFRGK